jgi:arylsulfatase A-like enzyme
MLHSFPRAAAALTLLCATACAAAPAAAPQRHVVVISVDGLRADAIAAAGATHLLRLQRDGAASLAARPVKPSVTLPNHLSMVTGLTPQAHGVTTNTDLPGEFPRPTLFTAAHGAGLRTGFYYGKSKLLALAPKDSADVRHGPGRGDPRYRDGKSRALAAAFAEEFPRERFAFTFIHLRDPDDEGHDHGWMSPAYLDGVRAADRALGRILDAIRDSDVAASTWVLLTADHGGHGDHHRGDAAEDWVIPWMCRGPGIVAGQALPDGIGNADVAPTVLAILGLPDLPGTEGHAVAQCIPRRAN